MRWRDYRRSSNVEDRRGMPVSRGGRLGIGGLIIVGLIALVFGIDPRVLLGIADNIGGGDRQQQQQEGRRGTPDDEMAQFASTVLATTEDAWDQIFRQNGRTYEPPTLALFSGATNSDCGFAQAAMGPFYCPNNRKIYIDLSFFQDMKRRFGATGDFGAAYVIAHEVGHHVQRQLGILGRGQRSNEQSVQTELQADCLAGIWARAAGQQNLLEQGDIEEAVQAADAIGDDRLQKQSQGYVTPDSFTHGSSAQRVRAFKTGADSGQLASCGVR